MYNWTCRLWVPREVDDTGEGPPSNKAVYCKSSRLQYLCRNLEVVPGYEVESGQCGDRLDIRVTATGHFKKSKDV